MSETTAVTIYNIAVIAMIAACSLGGMVFLHSAEGLWSLFAVVALASSSKEERSEDDPRGEDQEEG